MIDDKVLPFNGGEAPDDQALKTRMASAYHSTPPADERTIARCVRLVLEHAAAESSEAPAARRLNSRWMVGAAAVAAALLVSVTLRNRAGSNQSEQGTDSGNAEAVATTTAFAGGIQFGLRLPEGLAANVSVVGDFNGWDAKATPMVRDEKSGEWSAKITLLPGRHIYAYLVNGKKWVVDPLKPQIPDEGYGPANAVVVEEASK